MDYNDILISMRRVVRTINLNSKRVQKECGLSITQILALGFIKQCNNYQCSQLQLRRFLHLNSSTVTGLVARLSKRGLIAKLPKTGDKRETRLALTEHGLEQLDAAPPLLQEELTAKLEELPKEQVEQISKALEDLVVLLDAGDVDASPLLIIEQPR